MAILDKNFLDAFEAIEADKGEVSPIPPGDYTLKVMAASVEQSRGGGQYIKVTFDVIAPAYQGRKIFQNFTIHHANPEAVRIGISQIKALTTAIGISKFQDTDQLIGGLVLAKVTIRKSKDPQYPDQNDTRGYRPAGATPPQIKSGGAFSDAFQTQGSETSASSGNTPWSF